LPQGRLTNPCSEIDIFEHGPHMPRFLYSELHSEARASLSMAVMMASDFDFPRRDIS
jgi:hypothetical protein